MVCILKCPFRDCKLFKTPVQNEQRISGTQSVSQSPSLPFKEYEDNVECRIYIY